MSAAHRVPKKDFGYTETIGKKLPISIGANFNDDPICRNNLKKSHTLATNAELQPLVDSEDIAKYAPHTSYDFAGGESTLSGSATFNPMVKSSAAYGMAHQMGASTGSASSSSWRSPMAQDDAILRFLGYYRESVPESPDEKVRVRKVAVVFHTSDNTLLVREAPQANSGMAQGVILKRQQVPNPSDESGRTLYTEDDLAIGAQINIFGKLINIVDMDEAARKYYRAVKGRDDVPDLALPWPDADDSYNRAVERKRAMQQPKRQLPTADFDHKRVTESMSSGGIVTKHAPDDVRTAQQFLRNKINEHLSFLAIRDDRDKLSGDLRYAVIRYFLENDTVEIVEARDDNCGREGGVKLLNRQRIPADAETQPPIGSVTGPAQQNTFGLLLKSGYMTYDKFAPGQTLKVYSHVYFVYDADPFTRQFFKANVGRDFGEAADITEVQMRGSKPLPRQYPPPHNGFGSEDDSLQSWKSLMLKAPKVDVNKVKAEEGKVMLFRAEFARTLQPEDEGRQFLVSFHRATDEVEIVERQIRNAGIVGGKFLAKGKHMKVLPDGRRVPFAPEDFVVGKEITITGRTFVLTELDERSRRQCNNEVSEVSEDRVRDLIVALKDQLNAKYVRMHEAFRAMAPTGVLGAAELREFFDRASGPITEEESLHLIRYFAGDNSGTVNYSQFIKMMDVKNSSNMDETCNSRRAVKDVSVFGRDSEEARNVTRALQQTSDEAADRTRQRRLRKMLVDKLVERRGTVQEVFRLMSGHASNNKMTRAAFEAGLRDVLHVALPPKDHELLVRMVFANEEQDKAGIGFRQFFEFVESV